MTLLIHYININGVMWYKPYLRFKIGSNKTVQVCCCFVLASVCLILVQITWFFLNWKIGCQSTCPQDFINLAQVFLTQQNNLCESDQHSNGFVAHCMVEHKKEDHPRTRSNRCDLKETSLAWCWLRKSHISTQMASLKTLKNSFHKSLFST